MTPLRNDGDITVFVLRHVHPNKIQKGWDGESWDESGDCSQFEKTYEHRKLFNPFSASGEVWQRYGIHATMVRREAIACAAQMADLYPHYHWSVAKVHIAQKTDLIITLHAEA